MRVLRTPQDAALSEEIVQDKDRSYCMSFHTRGADFRAVFVSAASAINAATKQVNVH